MKTFIWVTLAASLNAFAQPVAPTDLEARRQSVETLKQHITSRQARLDEVSAEIRTSGQTIDKKIEKLVATLAGLKDSQDSKRRISQIKAEAIIGLKRMILTFDVERRNLSERLRSGDTASAEALNKDIGRFGELIDKRANDIVELVKSIPGGVDVAKYESDGGSYNGYRDTYYENSRISETWRQSRRDKTQSEKQRREVQDALEKAIAQLGNQKNAAETAVAQATTATDKELQQEELDRLKAQIDLRKSQLVEISIPSAEPANSASQDQAQDMEVYLRDARQDVSADFGKTLRLYHQAVAEREKIADLRVNLAAREKWLSENDPAAKKSE